MPDPARRALLALLVIFTAALSRPDAAGAQSGCLDGGRLVAVDSDSDGIGGTGLRPGDPDEGGIGGTGHSGNDPDEGGIGGTGIRAEGDSGIIGVITGFGSICVGGTEIYYDPDTPVFRNGDRVDAAMLAVGQVVEVIADGSGAETHARTIGIKPALRGPIDLVSSVTNRVEVLGQTVELSDATWTGSPAEPRPAAISALTIGDFVEVSGFRRADGVVVASRVADAPATDTALLSGPVSHIEANRFFVGATRIDVPAGSGSEVSVGDQIDVAGEWTGSSVVARTVNVEPPVPFDGRVKRVELEGYVQEGFSGRELRVGAYRVELSEDDGRMARAALQAGQPIRVDAVIRPDRGAMEGHLSRIRTLPGARDRARPPVGPGAASSRGQEPKGAPPGPPDDGRRHGGGARAPGGAPAHPQGANLRGERPNPPERPPVPERPERPERPDPPERPERPDRPQRPPRPERPDRPRGP